MSLEWEQDASREFKSFIFIANCLFNKQLKIKTIMIEFFGDFEFWNWQQNSNSEAARLCDAWVHRLLDCGWIITQLISYDLLMLIALRHRRMPSQAAKMLKFAFFQPLIILIFSNFGKLRDAVGIWFGAEFAS